ncbi:MAG: glucose-1-phosphate thymidylyltransferase RfbA [Actinobacteria bacterium]|uniref:glucose-1-phosphate thymidylyltransferase n=1 Tax=freshwater metagenome TaxID=449393 RepID=A0A6J6GQL0_9ZZZZ|nr:glucose-1-phosphate thymidylyltransferase RfbA [Actinomycetota bacterium]
MKGIILAGGTGSRLWPITKVVSKQLLPVYDKPMIYYPISTLMLAGVKEILIITTPDDASAFKSLLGDGTDLGITFEYAVQPKPEGLAQAFIISEEFLNGDSVLMILGDNIFHGEGLGTDLHNKIPDKGAHIFTYEVSNPSDYGVLNLDTDGKVISVVEKPISNESNMAITGLYYFDGRVSELSKSVKPSKRGELEIISLIEIYLAKGELTFSKLSRGTAWLDTGKPNSLNDASIYIRVLEERTGLKVACLEEIAWRQGWITQTELNSLAEKYGQSEYGKYLKSLKI